MRLSRLALAATIALCLSGPVSGGALVNPEVAPEWRVSEWINGDPGTVGSQKGRVVVIHFFQLWCPGCNNFTIPLFQRWDQLWGDRDDFMTVSIHTVFEGHDYQTAERLREFVREKGIWHPVGIDASEKPNDLVPFTMRQYKNIGTPQVAVIDKEGRLLFNHFGEFDPSTVEFMIERLLKEESDVKPPPKPKIGRNKRISGRYKLQFEQTEKSCGKLRDPWESNMTLDVYPDHMLAEFSLKLMGLSSLTAEYNSRTLRFNATASKTDRMRGADVESAVTINGRFVQGSKPARLEYEVKFTRLGGPPDTECEILGRGWAQRIGD